MDDEIFSRPSFRKELIKCVDSLGWENRTARMWWTEGNLNFFVVVNYLSDPKGISVTVADGVLYSSKKFREKIMEIAQGADEKYDWNYIETGSENPAWVYREVDRLGCHTSRDSILGMIVSCIDNYEKFHPGTVKRKEPEESYENSVEETAIWLT